MNDILVRPFAEGDEPALAALITELGYPSTSQQIHARMVAIRADPDHATLLAVTASGEVIGMVGTFTTISYEHDTPIGRITGLIVSEKARRTGVGRRLMAEAETWVRSRGCNQLTLTTHLRRTEAHEFYRRLGYEETGKRFVRRFR